MDPRGPLTRASPASTISDVLKALGHGAAQAVLGFVLVFALIEAGIRWGDVAADRAIQLQLATIVAVIAGLGALWQRRPGRPQAE